MTELPDINADADITLQRRQSLEATVRRACPKCGAPPTFVSSFHVKEHWPGNWVPRGDPRENKFVPDDAQCPSCGAQRPKPVQMGEIWIKEMLGRMYHKITRR